MFVGNIQLYFFLGIQIDTEIWIDVDNGTILEGTKNYFIIIVWYIKLFSFMILSISWNIKCIFHLILLSI